MSQFNAAYVRYTANTYLPIPNLYYIHYNALSELLRGSSYAYLYNYLYLFK